MAGHIGGVADTIALVVASSAILVAVLGVAIAGRSQARRLREESGHADQVFGRTQPDPDSAAVRLSARRRSHGGEAGRTEPGELATIARQEAEIYLQHHRMALRHHSAYHQAALWSGLLGFSVVLIGGVLTYLAGLDVGAVTALAGIIPAAAGGLLLRQAKIVGDRAAENLRGLEDSVRRFNALQGALVTTAEIGDRQARDRVYEVIAMSLLSPADEPEPVPRDPVEEAEDVGDTGQG
ncbi:hypothetical protein AB0H12_44550 [Actinosynnema sp. NPDC023794]